MPNLFVYGTLKKGFRNHHFLASAELLYETALPNSILLHLGGFPGLIQGVGEVQGEVYRITEDMLPALDRLEGVPTLFQREFFEKQDFFVYVFQPMMDLKEYGIIETGRWT